MAEAERKLFGTDGIRGVANVHPMTPELALALGRAVTFVAGRGKRHAPRVLIGKDTRLSGYMLEQAIASGICSMVSTNTGSTLPATRTARASDLPSAATIGASPAGYTSASSSASAVESTRTKSSNRSRVRV